MHEIKNKRVTSIGWLPHTGTNLQPRHVPLTGNQACDPSMHRPKLQPVSSMGLSACVDFCIKLYKDSYRECNLNYDI